MQCQLKYHLYITVASDSTCSFRMNLMNKRFIIFPVHHIMHAHIALDISISVSLFLQFKNNRVTLSQLAWCYVSVLSLAFARGVHLSPVISPHKVPETRKIFPFDDVIMHAIFMTMLPSSKAALGITLIISHYEGNTIVVWGKGSKS